MPLRPHLPTVREVWLALLPEFHIELLPASLQFGRPVLAHFETMSERKFRYSIARQRQ